MNATPPQSTRRVALLGATRNTDNYGVRVLLTSAIEALSVLEPDAEVVSIDYGRQSEAWVERTSIGDRRVRLVNLRFSWRLLLPNNIFRLVLLAVAARMLPGSALIDRARRRNPWLDDVLKVDTHYSLAGGDSFSDIYGLERFFYVTLPQILVLLLGRPLVLLPQTYGPFNGRTSRLVARWILLRASKIYSRDALGVETVRVLTGPDGPAVHVVPDLGFGMSTAPVENGIMSMLAAMRQQRPLVGLNVSQLLYMGGYNGANMFGLRESFPALVEILAVHVAQKLDCEVLLIPHVCGGPNSEEDETRLCARLSEILASRTGGRVHHLDKSFDHQQMKCIIGACDVFIGARMHACIAAVSQGVPTVCLAYSSKFEGVMRPLGHGARVVDLRTASSQDTIEVVDDVFHTRERLRMQLSAEVSAVRQRARTLGGVLAT